VRSGLAFTKRKTAMRKTIVTGSLCLLALIAGRATLSQEAAREPVIGGSAPALPLSTMTTETGHWPVNQGLPSWQIGTGMTRRAGQAARANH
jgi:hypothetical protein